MVQVARVIPCIPQTHVGHQRAWAHWPALNAAATNNPTLLLLACQAPLFGDIMVNMSKLLCTLGLHWWWIPVWIFGSKVSWPLWWRIAVCPHCNLIGHLGNIDWEWHTSKSTSWWLYGIQW